MMLYMLFGLLWPLLHALGLLSVSAIAASRDPIVLQLVGVLAAALLPLRGVYDLLMSIAKGGGVHRAQLLQTGVELLLAAAVIVLPNYSYGAFVILFELCLTFYIAVSVVDAFIYAKHRMRRFMIPAIVQAAFFLHIFLAILLMPGVVRRRALEIGTGVAMALFGLANLCDFLALAIRSRKARTILGYIRVTAPGVLALSIPHRLMCAVKSAPIREKSENDVNLEVFFRYGKTGVEFAGHCEICLDGYTYTYGNYDPASRRLLGAVGRGVMIRAEKEKYIDWCVRERGKMMLVYGLHLSEADLQGVRSRAQALDECLKPWDREVRLLDARQYARRLCESVPAHAYQVTDGRFATYFIPSINCVKLVDYFLGDSAVGHMIIPGVYSPGAYMDVLQRLYDTGSETVVSLRKYGIR